MVWKQISIIALLLAYGVMYLMISSRGYYSWRSAEWGNLFRVFRTRFSRPVGWCAWDNIGHSSMTKICHMSVDNTTLYLNAH
jgi:uncharacterized membrane protein (DUF2068 family)